MSDAPSRLGVIVLGASRFPNYPGTRQLDNASFARSAAAFRSAMSTPDTCLLGNPAILDLFDAEEEPGPMVRRIKAFLSGNPGLTDVILYYCGHGDFLADTQKTYVLTLRSTEPDNEAFTALPLRQLRLSLDAQLAAKRLFIVLDCCFAGRAVTEWQADGLGHVIEEQVFQSFPKRGTTLVAASAKGMPAIAPEGEALTMFTGAMVEAIRGGLAGAQKTLSFRDVFAIVRSQVVERYGSRAAIPVIHAPHQPEGDISFDPFFLNRGFRPPPEPEATAAEREIFEFATADLNRPLVQTRAAAVQALADLHDSVKSMAFQAEIRRRLEIVADEDDSNTVRMRARAGLAALIPPETAPPQASGPFAGSSGGTVLKREEGAVVADTTPPAIPRPSASVDTVAAGKIRKVVDEVPSAGDGSASGAIAWSLAGPRAMAGREADPKTSARPVVGEITDAADEIPGGPTLWSPAGTTSATDREESRMRGASALARIDWRRQLLFLILMQVGTNIVVLSMQTAHIGLVPLQGLIFVWAGGATLLDTVVQFFVRRGSDPLGRRRGLAFSAILLIAWLLFILSGR